MRPKNITLLLTLLGLASSPLMSQSWDFRLEYPMPKGQNLPQTMITGVSDIVKTEKFDTGKGLIFTAGHRIIRLGPILRFDGLVEFAQFKTDGKFKVNDLLKESTLKQHGFGAGLNARFDVPFIGLSGEIALIHRFQTYKFNSGHDVPEIDDNINRTWMRVGVRYTLPIPIINPYLAASYQQPFSKDKPVNLTSAEDLQALLTAQGTGQEFDRMWTFGVGVQF